jgi:predicted nucleic acid-binding protein
MTAVAVIVLDASALVDLLLRGQHHSWVSRQLADRRVSSPGHMLAEVLNAVGTNVRRGGYPDAKAGDVLEMARRLPIEHVAVSDLLVGAWARREQHALADALYVELAAQLDTVVVTTDFRLARATRLAVAPPD